MCVILAQLNILLCNILLLSWVELDRVEDKLSLVEMSWVKNKAVCVLLHAYSDGGQARVRLF